jgi:hypothetical protein
MKHLIKQTFKSYWRDIKMNKEITKKDLIKLLVEIEEELK